MLRLVEAVFEFFPYKVKFLMNIVVTLNIVMKCFSFLLFLQILGEA